MRTIGTVQVLLFGGALAMLTAAATAQQLLEPIALPPAVEQGVDMVYVDPRFQYGLTFA